MKPGYKQTDVGMIPEDWLEYTVGELIDFEGGSQPDKSVFSPSLKPGYVRLIQIRDYKTDKFETYVPRNLARRFCSKNDIMIGRYGPPIFQILRGLAGAYNVALIKAKPHTEINQGYAYYFLIQKKLFTFVQKLSQRSSGQTGIDLKELKAYPLPLPPTKAEQEIIAEALSDADALIESLEQLLTKKRQIKKGAMQELLTGKKHLPGFSGEWEVKRLGSIARIQRGASPRPIDSPVWFDDTSAIGWVRISDVTGSGMFLHQTAQRLSPLGVQHSRPVSSGSLIMSICATVGQPIITSIDVCIHDGFVVLDDLQANQLFVYYLLSSIESEWSKHGQTGSQMNLNTDLIKRTEILFPPVIAEQTAIATVLSDMDEEIAALEAKLSKAHLLKQGMMQELLTGRIRLL